MFRIKICGITNYDDARVAVDAGADALGFNFYRGSKRYIEPQGASAIIGRLPDSVLKVGVFVNSAPAEINEAIEHAGIDYVQLHGDESAQIVEQIVARVPVVRAHRCTDSGLRGLAQFLQDCRSLGRNPAAVLLDSGAVGDFGGTGRTLDWESLSNARSEIGDARLILAGGLSAENVAEAIRAVQPDGVDVASGVERAPGVKEPALVTKFVSEADQALSRICQL
jgi:phosphoribosylanthranilate isomerase